MDLRHHHHRGQRGQAIVLVAFSLVVLIGFIGLSIDGGSAYWERRVLQNAVDAAALAASDNYQTTTTTSTSMQAAAREYAANERIYSAASPNPGWTASTIDVTWSGSNDKLHLVSSVTGSFGVFDVTSIHKLRLAFMSVFGIGPTISVGATAQGRAKTGGTSGAGLVTLSGGNCSGGGNSLSIQSGASIKVLNGNVISNGSTALGTGNLSVSNGSFSSQCAAIPAGVTASKGIHPGSAPVSDPAFPPGSLTAYPSPQSAGANVTLNPGIYSADLGTLTGTCYFLSAGVYQLDGGWNATSGYFSNQLRAPDEPAWTAGAPNYNNSLASPQWWGTCSGSFTVTGASNALALQAGSWGVIVTSTRTDYYPSGGTAYQRESAPSTCHAVTLPVGQALTVTINNVPGALGYNVYAAYTASGNACAAGPWGYIGNIVNGITETQTTRGSVSTTFTSSTITALPTPANIGVACASSSYALNCAAATGGFGAANPPGDGGETAPMVPGVGAYPPGPPAQDIPSAGGGDRANEHYCLPAGISSANPCALATVTPGAVQLYFKAAACYSFTNTANMRVFGGYQYNWMTVYAPPANNCSPQISDSASVVVIGTYYWPSGNFSLNGNPGYLIYFTQIIAFQYSSQGNETLTIGYDSAAVAPQGFSQISN